MELEEQILRARIAGMLRGGLKTQTEPFPENEKEFAKIVDQLRALKPDDITGKLQIGGFTLEPYGPDKLRCQECIYYLVARKWCDLPELAVPVEADWWCRLWRV